LPLKYKLAPEKLQLQTDDAPLETDTRRLRAEVNEEPAMAWLRHRFGNQQITTAPTDLDQQVRARGHHTHHHTPSAMPATTVRNFACAHF
jgi:hypothetical protein